ncbi:MAG TPA: MbcA/ParS/Xre antitoxin family protein [bacterium]|nr:MbcA/ParS/Xre antitoxin family protein [bacterium]
MADSPGDDDRSNLEKILEVVYMYHHGDRAKVDEWLREPNTQLGGETPIEMIRTNRLETLVDLLRMMVADLEARQ